MASDPATAYELDEEQRLVMEAQRGNLNAMRPILERYAPPLYARVILPRIGNARAAEEVLCDTLATAVERIDQFTWQGKTVYPWLRQIALHKITDQHRREQRSQRLADAMRSQTATATLPGDAADAQLVAAEELRANRERIEETLVALHPRYREAIELRLVRECSREECATQLGVTTATFDVLLFRAIRAFRKQFGEPEVVP